MKHSDKEENDFGAASMMDNMLPTYAAVMANNSQSALPAAQPVARGPSDDELDEFVTTLKTQVGNLCNGMEWTTATSAPKVLSSVCSWIRDF